MSSSATISVRSEPTISARDWVLGAIVVGLLLTAFRAPILWMVERWGLPDSYYSHGFLVPLVAGYFVWRDRRELLGLRPERSLLGLACLLAGVSILLISGVLSIYFTAGFALILTLWGGAGFLFGLRAMRRLVFPMFILLFMVPPPLQMIEDFSLRLKLMVAEVTLALLNAIGITTVNNGSTIYLGDAVVTVGNACSGLRSLISLVFLGVLFATVSRLSPVKRVALFLASMPIAIVSNVARVFVLCLVAYHWGSDSLTREVGIGSLKTTAHDASGYLIFVVAFALLYVTLLGLGKVGRRRAAAPETEEAEAKASDEAFGKASGKPSGGEADEDRGASPAPGNGKGLAARWAAVLALAGLSALASARLLYPAAQESAELRTGRIPMLLGAWVGQEVTIDEYVTRILETNDVVQRNYYNPLYGNRPVQLAVVFSPSNRRVAHPPEVCYTGGGWEVNDKTFETFEGVGPMVRLKLHFGRRSDLVIYCFKAGPDFTASYYQQQMNIVRNMLTQRATSSALVRISTVIPEGESDEQAERRLLDFARRAMPELREKLN